MLQSVLITHIVMGPSFKPRARVQNCDREYLVRLHTASTSLSYHQPIKILSSVQVGYTTTAPYFANKESFPLFARTMEATLLHNAAIIKILERFNWTRVAKIVPTTEYVMAVSTSFQIIFMVNESMCKNTK